MITVARPTTEILNIANIRLDGGTQSRAELSEAWIEELTQVLLDGKTFKDPIVVFYDGSNYWLADGFHRVRATKRANSDFIDADIRQGTQDEAIEYSCGANATHGLRRTTGDIKRAIERLIVLPKWKNRTQEEIAQQCGATQPYVSMVLKDLKYNTYKKPISPPVEPYDVNERVGNSPSLEERRESVKRWFEENPTLHHLSDREIAKKLNVDHKTVGKIRKELFPAPEPEIETNSAIEAPITHVSESGATSETELATNIVVDLGVPPATEEIVETSEEICPAQEIITPQQFIDDVFPDFTHLQQENTARRNIDNIPIAVPHISSKNNEWYTPEKYIQAAREVMGGIDLDPASCAQANEIVQATKYYDIQSNGLDKDWSGRVWLNPPYGRGEFGSNQDIWSSRLDYQYTKGITIEAILLVNAAVDTYWFQRLFNHPICFPSQRINFSTPEPTVSGSTHGSAFVYFGPYEKERRFAKVFGRFGTVVRRWQ